LRPEQIGDKSRLCAQRDRHGFSTGLASCCVGQSDSRFETSAPFLTWSHRLQTPHLNTRQACMRSRLIAVVGLLLSSCLPLKAQTPATQIALTQASPVLTTILFPASRIPLSPIVLPIQLFGKPFPHPEFLLEAAYKPDPSLESRLPIESFRTPLLTESTFLVAHLWRGLKLDFFQSTLHSHGPQLGSPTSGVGSYYLRPSTNGQAGLANSVRLSGISLRYSFGRDAERGKPVPIWRYVSRVIGKGLNPD